MAEAEAGYDMPAEISQSGAEMSETIVTAHILKRPKASLCYVTDESGVGVVADKTKALMSY